MSRRSCVVVDGGGMEPKPLGERLCGSRLPVFENQDTRAKYCAMSAMAQTTNHEGANRKSPCRGLGAILPRYRHAGGFPPSEGRVFTTGRATIKVAAGAGTAILVCHHVHRGGHRSHCHELAEVQADCRAMRTSPGPIPLDRTAGYTLSDRAARGGVTPGVRTVESEPYHRDARACVMTHLASSPGSSSLTTT
jgi:hypothetical protein